MMHLIRSAAVWEACEVCRRRLPGFLTASLLFAATCGPAAADMTVISFEHQIKQDVGPNLFFTESSVTAQPDGTYILPNGTLRLSAADQGGDPFALKASASIELAVDDTPLVAQSWFSTEARAYSEVLLTDTALVQGVATGSSGTIRFTWALTGTETHALDTSGGNSAQIVTFSSSANLSSDMTALLGDLPFEVIHDYPNAISTDETYSQTYPTAAPTLTFDVPWTQGTNVDVSFTLGVEALMHVANDGDSVRFDGSIIADFGNTARLVTAQIFDSSGGFLPSAYLNGGLGAYPVTAVPEPALGVWLTLFGVPGLVAARRCQRWRREAAA